MNQIVIAQVMTLEERRAFIKLPLDERRRLMRQQATLTADIYEHAAATEERLQWQGGDLGEHVQQSHLEGS